jgi:DNA-binding NtrC family response regulator
MSKVERADVMACILIVDDETQVRDVLRQILEAEGIQLRLNAKCISLAKRDGRIAVGIADSLIASSRKR